jgi:Rrf2 family protein
MAIRLTRAGDYAIRGMLYLAEQPEGRITPINEIAEKRDIPKGFLSKIFQTLSKAGLVRSAQGNTGGFLLGKAKGDISLRDIVEAVEGSVFLNRCLIHAGECPFDQECPAHLVWKKAQEKLMEVLEEANLAYLLKNKPCSGESSLDNG